MPGGDELRARVERKAAEGVVPFTAHVDLTMACNHDCVHCYRVVEDRQELSTEEVLALLDDLHQLGTFFLTLSGGEVTLRRDLWQILARARELRFSTRLKTNAYSIAEEQVARIQEHGVTSVDVSLYGADAETHDRVTRVAGSFERTTRAVRLLSKNDIRVNIRAAVININQDEVARVKILARELGATEALFNARMLPGGNRASDEPVALEYDDAVETMCMIAEKDLTERAPQMPPDARFCSAGHSLVYIGPYGDVSPCVSFPLSCGNIRQRPLKEIWHETEALKVFRRARYRDFKASGKVVYHTHCPGRAYLKHGDYLACENMDFEVEASDTEDLR